MKQTQFSVPSVIAAAMASYNIGGVENGCRSRIGQLPVVEETAVYRLAKTASKKGVVSGTVSDGTMRKRQLDMACPVCRFIAYCDAVTANPVFALTGISMPTDKDIMSWLAKFSLAKAKAKANGKDKDNGETAPTNRLADLISK